MAAYELFSVGRKNSDTALLSVGEKIMFLSLFSFIFFPKKYENKLVLLLCHDFCKL